MAAARTSSEGSSSSLARNASESGPARAATTSAAAARTRSSVWRVMNPFAWSADAVAGLAIRARAASAAIRTTGSSSASRPRASASVSSDAGRSPRATAAARRTRSSVALSFGPISEIADGIGRHPESDERGREIDLLLRFPRGLDELRGALRGMDAAHRQRRRASGLARASRQDLHDERVERGRVVVAAEGERRRERVPARLLRHDAGQRIERARIAKLAQDQRGVPGKELIAALEPADQLRHAVRSEQHELLAELRAVGPRPGLDQVEQLVRFLGRGLTGLRRREVGGVLVGLLA